MRKLHSLSGTLPVGGFLLLHLWTNAHALSGRQNFDEAVQAIHDLPFLLWLEVLGIYVPLLFHALYGIKLSFEGRPNLRAYPLTKNWAYALQRVTGLIAFVFIVMHLWQFRVQVSLGHMDHTDFYSELCASLSGTTASGIPVMALAYLIGVAACAFHFANGLAGFCFSWGITSSARAQRTLSNAFGVVGILVFLLGAITVIYFATGATLLGGSGQSALYHEANRDRWATCADSSSGRRASDSAGVSAATPESTPAPTPAAVSNPKP